MANRAAFTLDGTPSEHPTTGRGFDAVAGQVIACQLEDIPALDALSVTFEVQNNAAPEVNGPLASKDAPQATFTGGVAKKILASPDDITSLTIPANAILSTWVVRCTVVTANGIEYFDRAVAVREGESRAFVPYEETEYDSRGYGDSLTGLAASASTANAVVRRPARIAATANIADLSNAGANMDGVALVVGDRVLLPTQSDPIENGVYVVASLTPTVLTRATDMAAASSVAPGLSVAVQEGTYWPGSTWTLTGSGALTVSTDALRFVPDETRIDARKRFGVRADGTTDDTAAVRAAATAGNAYGIPVEWPAGVIRITDTLDWRSDGTTRWNALHIRGHLPLSLPDYGVQQTILEWDGATNDPMIRVSAGVKLENFTVRVKAGKATVAAIDHNQHTNIGAPVAGKCVFRELTILGDLYDLGSYGTMDYGIVCAREPYRRSTNTTQSGAGPAVTFTGVPDGAYDVRVKITLGGIRGTAQFDWSLDGGSTWEATGVATAATVVLGTTGLTANFAAGTYVLNETYDITTSAVPNLEFSTYDECYIFHQEIASVAILSQSGQAKSHKFNDCQLGEGPKGLELKTGSFVWRGGGFQGAVRGVDISGSGPSDWCVIYDCNSERCGRLLDRTSGYSAVGAPMKIDGGRFSLDDDYLLDGGAGFINWKIPTPITICDTLWENANVADPTIPCIGLEHPTHEPRLVSFGNQYLNANFVRAYAEGTYSSHGDCYAPDGITESTEIASTPNARCDTTGPMSPGEIIAVGALQYEGGRELRKSVSTTNATPGTADLLTLGADGENASVSVVIRYRKSTGEVGRFRRWRDFKREGGVSAALAATETGGVDQDPLGVGGVDLVLSSHTIQAQVTGLAATDLTWTIDAQYLD